MKELEKLYKIAIFSFTSMQITSKTQNHKEKFKHQSRNQNHYQKSFERLGVVNSQMLDQVDGRG